MLAKVVFKPQLFFHSTFKVAVPDPRLNLKIGSAFSRVNEIKSTGPLHTVIQNLEFHLDIVGENQNINVALR